MKRIILILTVMIGLVTLNSSFTTISTNKSITKKVKFATVNVNATNSTSDGVYVSLENNTSQLEEHIICGFIGSINLMLQD